MESYFLLILFYILIITLGASILRCIPKQDKRFLIVLLAIAVIIQTSAFIFFNIFLFNNTIYSPDSNRYDEIGQQYADRLLHGDLSALQGGPGISYYNFVAVLYAVFGHFHSIPEITNSFLYLVSIVIMFYLTKKISNSSVAAKIASSLVMLYPSFIFWSTQISKDTLVIFINLLILFIMMNSTVNSVFFNCYLLLMDILLYTSIMLRNYTALVLGWSLIIAAVITKKRLWVIVVIVINILFIFYISGMGLIGQKMVTDQMEMVNTIYSFYPNLDVAVPSSEMLSESLTLLNFIREYMTQADSAYLVDYKFDSIGSTIKYVPIGLFYYLFSPFPGTIEISKIVMCLLEIILIYISFPFICWGIYHSIRNKFEHASPALIFSGIITLIYAIANSNIGTVLRWRMQTYVVLFIFAGIGISLLFKRKSKVNCADNSFPAGVQ